MELDDLKVAWSALDARIEAGHALNAKVLRELTLERTRSTLGPIWWMVGIELAIAVGAAVLLGAFLADHWRLPRFALPALALDVVAVLAIASAVGQLRILSAIDFAQPVVSIQRALMDLAVRRVRKSRWHWLLMFPLWTPMAIVVMQGLFAFDVYRWFGTGWIVANLAVGVGATPLMMWVVRRLDDRIQREGIVKGLADDIAGRRLAAAMTRMDEIALFEDER